MPSERLMPRIRLLSRLWRWLKDLRRDGFDVTFPWGVGGLIEAWWFLTPQLKGFERRI
jgi:hypothetical protein